MMGSYKILRTERFAATRADFPEWLATELRNRRVMTGRIVAEEFGWSMKLRNTSFAMRVECGSRNDGHTEWGMYVVAEASIFQRMFQRVGVRQELERLTAVLDQIVHAQDDSPEAG